MSQRRQGKELVSERLMDVGWALRGEYGATYRRARGWVRVYHMVKGEFERQIYSYQPQDRFLSTMLESTKILHIQKLGKIFII